MEQTLVLIVTIQPASDTDTVILTRSKLFSPFYFCCVSGKLKFISSFPPVTVSDNNQLFDYECSNNIHTITNIHNC